MIFFILTFCKLVLNILTTKWSQMKKVNYKVLNLVKHYNFSIGHVSIWDRWKRNVKWILETLNVGFINPGSPVDLLPYKTRPSRRRNDSTRLGRPRCTITGQDHNPVPDRHLRPGPRPTSGAGPASPDLWDVGSASPDPLDMGSASPTSRSRAPPRPTPFLRSRIRRTSTHCSFTTDTVEDDWERQTGDARSV